MPGPSLPLLPLLPSLPLLPLLVIAGNVYPQCFLKERLSVKNTLKLKGFQTPGHAVQLRIKAVLRADSPVRPWFGASAKLKVRLDLLLLISFSLFRCILHHSNKILAFNLSASWGLYVGSLRVLSGYSCFPIQSKAMHGVGITGDSKLAVALSVSLC